MFDESGKPIRYGCSVYTSKNFGTLTDSVGRYSLSMSFLLMTDAECVFL